MASVEIDLGPREVYTSLVSSAAAAAAESGVDSPDALDDARITSAKAHSGDRGSRGCASACVWISAASPRVRVAMIGAAVASVLLVVVAAAVGVKLAGGRSSTGSTQPGPAWPLPSIALANAADAGVFLPYLGLGTGAYGSSPSVGYGHYPECGMESKGCGDYARRAVREWIAAGGTRIDASSACAWPCERWPFTSSQILPPSPPLARLARADDYDNQRSVGLGIADSGAPRASLFVLSKVGPALSLGFADALAQTDAILAAMGLAYVDALLIHWPDVRLHGDTNETRSSETACRPADVGYNATLCRLDTWRALVQVWRGGRARAIGVSNFNETHLAEIEAAGLPLPSMNQVVLHPYRSASQGGLLRYMRQRGIVLDAYSPLGVPDVQVFPPGGGSEALAPTVLQDPVVVAIAAAHAPATPAQVVLAWLWQLGATAVPRSQNASHMLEDLRVFGAGAAAQAAGPGAANLTLTAADMAALSSRPQNLCADDPSWYECDPVWQ